MLHVNRYTRPPVFYLEIRAIKVDGSLTNALFWKGHRFEHKLTEPGPFPTSYREDTTITLGSLTIHKGFLFMILSDLALDHKLYHAVTAPYNAAEGKIIKSELLPTEACCSAANMGLFTSYNIRYI